MSTTSLVGHDSLNSLALARGRKRAYRPRNTGGVDGQYIVDRILALIAAQPITPSLRQIYYLLANEGTIPKGKYSVIGRGGKLVERDSAQELSERVTRMRKGGILAYDALVDGGRARRTAQYFNKPSEALAYAASVYYVNRWRDQLVIPELWGEAGSVENILWQIAYQFDVDVMVAHGNSSLTFLFEAANMIAVRWARGVRTRILYCGDLDPSGWMMSETLFGKLYEIGAPPEAYTVERIAITLEQVRAFSVQGHSLNEKDNNTPRYKREVHPDTCWELEALRPADLQEIIRDEILATITDERAWDETWNTCQAQRVVLAQHAREHGLRLDADTEDGADDRYLDAEAGGADL